MRDASTRNVLMVASLFARVSFSTSLVAQILLKTINWQFIFGRMALLILLWNSSRLMGLSSAKKNLNACEECTSFVLPLILHLHSSSCCRFNFCVLCSLHFGEKARSHFSKEFSIEENRNWYNRSDISLDPSHQRWNETKEIKITIERKINSSFFLPLVV